MVDAAMSFDAAIAGPAPACEAVSPPNAAYPRRVRMTTPAEFDRCLRRPAFYRSGPFALHLYWVDASDGHELIAPTWRLGLVIPKRYEATAVGRNTIKRRWRDAFRRGHGSWSGEFGSADLVVRLQAPLVPKASKSTAKSGPRSGRAADDAKLEAKQASKARPVATAAAIATPRRPAHLRARERFDPDRLLTGLVERLRDRGGRPTASAASAAVSPPSRSAVENVR